MECAALHDAASFTHDRIWQSASVPARGMMGPNSASLTGGKSATFPTQRNWKLLCVHALGTAVGSFAVSKKRKTLSNLCIHELHWQIQIWIGTSLCTVHYAADSDIILCDTGSSGGYCVAAARASVWICCHLVNRCQITQYKSRNIHMRIDAITMHGKYDR